MTNADPDAGPADERGRRWVLAVLWCLIAVVVALPVVQLGRELTQAHPVEYAYDEDAYYTFTIARELGTGHGITIDGHTATSGTQALWTLLTAVPFALHLPTTAALAFIGGLCLATWLAAGAAFSAILTGFVPPGPVRRGEARLLFAFVLLSAQLLRGFAWGGLETGLYVAVLLGTAWAFVFGARAAQRSDALFAVAAVVLVLSRVEAVVLLVVLAVARASMHRGGARRRAVLVPLLAGSAALLLQAAWDWHVARNVLPQSGIAESRRVYSLGRSVTDRAAVDRLSLDVVWPFLPTHVSEGAALATGALFLVVVLALQWRAPLRIGRRRGRTLAATTGAAVLIGVAYVVQSSAFLFYDRYFVTIEVVVLGVTALALWRVASIAATALGRGWSLRWAPAAVLVVPALVTVAIVRHEQWSITPHHMGPESVALGEHTELAACGPVGMWESGRVGFVYPTRVVNLDGKVNPAALQAHLHGHTLLGYLDREHIQVIYMRPHSEPFMDLVTPGWRRTWHVVPDARTTVAELVVRDGATCVRGS